METNTKFENILFGREWLPNFKIKKEYFRVISYNILAPSLIGHVEYSAPSEYLDWKYRLPLIIKYFIYLIKRELNNVKGDIVCLQVS